MVPFGLVAAGVVVVVVLPPVLVPPDAAGAVVPVFAAEAVPLPGVPGVPELLAGVAAGVEAGSTVIGVGSGGSGFDRIPATNWSIPVVVLLLRYLYQSVSLSFQTFFGSAKFASLPASATARA